jgi:Tol biopolymer transport system component
VFLHVREKPPAPAPPVRFQVALPEKVTLTRGDSFAVSPDGRQLAFVAAGTDGVSRVWVRALDSLEVRPLPGSEIGPVAAPLFWSPDSRYIVFQAETKLKKMDISGGPAQTLCDVTGFVVSGSWNRDGVIILGNNVSGRNGGALMRVPAAGGTCSPLTTLDPSRGENYHSFPSFLPDGRHFLYHRMSSAPQNAGIYVGSLDAKPEEQDSRQLLATPFGGRYVPPSDSAPGQLLFVREGTLMAQPFDAQRMELSGEAIPVAEQLGSFLNFAYISVSANGVLVYRSGATQDFQLTWFDRQGKALGTAGEQGQYSGVALSADGTRAAVTHVADQDLWLTDLSRGTSTRFTFGPGRARNPVWSPDGSRLIFASSREGVYDLYQKPASGAKEEEIVLKSGDNKFPLSWSRDGHFLLYLAVNRQTRNDLWVLPLDGDRKPFPFLRTEFDETQGRFSPDARWIAYMSNESGRPEVYVRPFSPPSAATPAETGGKWMVSKGGGNNPVWRGDGKDLMYVAPDGKVMAVELTANTAFQPGVPKALFQPPAFGQPADYDGGRDRSLLVVPVGQSTPPPFTVVLNWMAALKK